MYTYFFYIFTSLLISQLILHMSVGLPGPLRTTFELTILKIGVNKYARCGYTNVTCPSLAKNAVNIKRLFPLFRNFSKYLKFSKSGG